MKKTKANSSHQGRSKKLWLFMRLTLFLIFLGLMNLNAATSNAQDSRLSLNVKNATIEQVLDQLEENSDFYFYYKSVEGLSDHTVSGNFHDLSLVELLDKVLDGTNLSYRIVDNYVAIIPAIQSSDNVQQDFRVSGLVTDSSGEPLPGVNVFDKSNPSTGVITGIDGKYSITLSNENSVIVFSYIGFTTQEIQMVGRKEINITLVEETTGIDEVIVTALGIKKVAKKIGFAMDEVEGEDIASVNTVNLTDALKGKSAGVSIGQSDGLTFGSQKINIRGVSTMNDDNNNPIYVIDGVIIESTVTNASADWASSSNDYGNILKNLNPDDFETVNILKGAAATALYGSRGMNGAIVVTTKNGTGRKGIGVKVTQSFGVDHVYNQPDIQYEYGPGTYAGGVKYGETDADGNYYKWDVNQIYTTKEGVPTKQNNPNDGFLWGPKFDGREIIDYDGSMTSYRGYSNGMLDAYQNGWNSNTSVALSGGNEKSTFYLSDSYQKREGIINNNEFVRNALLAKSSYELTDWLRAEASVSVTSSKSQNANNELGSFYTQGDLSNWYDTKKWNKQEIWQAPHGGVPSSKYGDEYALVPANGTWFYYNNFKGVQNEQVTRPVVRITADLTNWMSVVAEGNMNHYTIKYEEKDLGTGYANEGGKYALRNTEDISQNAKLNFNINKQLNNDIAVNLVLGGEFFDQERSYTYAQTEGGLVVPGQYFIDNSMKDTNAEGKILGTKRMYSLYYLANFEFKNQLFVDITGRNDWSSGLVYTNGSGNHSYFYPSVSTAWLFSETFELPTWMTFGKLRASYAMVGNDTKVYSINKGYKSKTKQVNGESYYLNTKSDVNVDPNIKPEMKHSFEVGTDVRFLNSRVALDVAYYNETIKNQIGEVPLPGESGLKAYLTNVGTLTNKGLELSLTVKPIVSRDFNWTSTFTYWDNTTMVDDLHESYGAYKTLNGSPAYGNYRVGSVAFEGGEYGVLMSDSKPKVYNNPDNANDPANGKPVFNAGYYDSHRSVFYKRSLGKPQEVGKLSPDFEGAWHNDFSWKNWSMGISLDARFGGHMASYTNKYGTAYGIMKTSLAGRDASHGGITWTSQYDDRKGQTFNDGVIPEGVFDIGQKVTAPNGETVDVGGMTYQEAYDAGYVEPSHASFNTYLNNSWGTGTINDDWFSEVKYIALRNISVSYNVPQKFADKIKAQNILLSFNARNLGYLYNSLPNNLHPESFRGTASSAGFLERNTTPYTATYTFTISLDF